MRWYKEKGKRKLTGAAVAVIITSVIAAAVIGVAVYVHILLSGISSEAVPIVKVTPQNQVLPTQEPDLVKIEGEPEDIAEDYDEPIPVEATSAPIYYFEPIQEDLINILVIGSDSRSGQAEDGRSDTMMLISYDIKNARVTLVSFLRDIWVPIEGYGQNRLNTTFRFGGAGLTVNTINSLFGLDIQNYLIVDFDSMVQLVDRLGGIEVTLTEVEAGYYHENYGWNVKAGPNHLDGSKTLIHARNRKSNGGDFERTRRQRDVMLAVYHKVASSYDLATLSDLFTYFMEHAQTNMRSGKLFSLAVKAITAGSGSLMIDQGRIPVDSSWYYADKDGRSVIVIDFDKNKEWLMEQLYSDEP